MAGAEHNTAEETISFTHRDSLRGCACVRSVLAMRRWSRTVRLDVVRDGLISDRIGFPCRGLSLSYKHITLLR
jgi:hypothetical protein